MRIGKISVIVIGLVPFNVYAECTPTPDCADMGYTETSCSGKFVRCPFDTSKLFCAPCDSSFKYDCNGVGQIGVGNSCNGKYVSCSCLEDYELSDGICVVSCAYANTSLPNGCATADSCKKNETTYYSTTCLECKSGYSLTSGSCSVNACSGYYTSKTGCSSYSICLSGSTTKYKCNSCNTGYTLSSGKCSANSCNGYLSHKIACSVYSTCTKSSGTTMYKCTACNNGYVLSGAECVDEGCYNEMYEQISYVEQLLTRKSYSSYSSCSFTCTGTDGVVYEGGMCDE